MKKFKSILCATMMVWTAAVFAQDAPKREFRGVWIATVSNIDWPSKKNLSTFQQRDELIYLVNEHEKQGLNAVFFQVRPAADAFYKSKYEPWSQWLNGVQGKSQDDDFDPLEEMVQLCHKKGIELHAWFNPYRAVFNAAKPNVVDSHISKTMPEWFLTYEGKKMFNPGIPEVREYIVRIVLDVVDRYNIDGIHLDDYFYPYPVPGKKLNDEKTYKKYCAEDISIEDWRRQNVDKLIKMLSDSIHSHKPRVKFGISPFGIWQNKKEDPEGSETNGITSYHALYADSRLWLKEGWVDYIAPQLYFSFGNKRADFGILTDWWAANSFGKHFYIGHAPYRIGEKGGWSDPDQIPSQIRYGRAKKEVNGGIYFSSASLMKNAKGVTDSLKENYYANKALPPTMEWLDKVSPNPPKDVKLTKTKNGEITLSWTEGAKAADGEPVYGYVIYKFEENETLNLNSAESIAHISYLPQDRKFKDKWDADEKYYYVVTALDQAKNESKPSEKAILKK